MPIDGNRNPQCHTEIVDNQGCRPGLGDSVTTGHGAAFINQKADSNVTLFMGKADFVEKFSVISDCISVGNTVGFILELFG